MKSSIKWFAVALAVSISAASLAAEPIARGQKYVLRVPLNAMQFESVSAWSGGALYVANVELTETGIKVNGDANWLGKGFPDDKTLTVKKLRDDRKTGKYEVELGSDKFGDPALKLRFPSLTVAAQAIPQLLIEPTKSDEIAAWREAAWSELAKATFTESLASLPADKQRSILEALRGVNVSRVSVETFKEKPYLSVNFGSGDYVYNTLQMNRTERVARRTSEILGTLKSLYRALGKCPEQLHGVKVSYSAQFKNFVREYEESGIDSVDAYIPCELLAKFQDADITSQALINGSVIIVNGDRVEVALTQ